MAAARPLRFWILWAAAAAAAAALLLVVWLSVGSVPRIEAEREGKMQLALLRSARQSLQDRLRIVAALVEDLARVPGIAVRTAKELEGDQAFDRALEGLRDALDLPVSPEQWPVLPLRFAEGQAGVPLLARHALGRNLSESAAEPAVGARAAARADAARRGVEGFEPLGDRVPPAACLVFSAPLPMDPGRPKATLAVAVHVEPALRACLGGNRQNPASEHFVVVKPAAGPPQLVWHSAAAPFDGGRTAAPAEWMRVLATRAANGTNVFGAKPEQPFEDFQPGFALAGPERADRAAALAHVPWMKHGAQEWALFQATPVEAVSKAAAGSVVRWTTLGGVALGVLMATLFLFGRQVLRGERALQSVEATYRALFAENPAGMFLLDRRGVVVECNQTAGKLAGLEPAAVAGRALDDIFRSSELPRLRAALAAGADLHLEECRLVRVVDGVEALAETWGHPHGESWALVAHDIGKRREIEREIARFQRMDSMGALASTLAHDFNNRLGMIQIRLSNLRADLPLGELRDEAMAAERDVDDASQLVSGMLAFRDNVFSPEPVALEPLLQDFMQGLGHLCRDRQVAPALELAGPLPTVWITPQAFRRVLDNLCRNALDAMPGGGTLTIAAQPRTVEPGGRLPPGAYAALAVADTGQGIPDAHLDKVFAPLFTTKGPGKGTGLGLWTAYTILRNLGGDIAVRSAAGRGTRFELLLPHAAPGRDSSWFRKEQG